MEFEFDKEMDSLLRQTAKGENLFAKVNTPTEHIDADEISMFAENALPEKTKPRVMKHLADCDRCRTILSNVIALNAEDEQTSTVIAPAKVTMAETVVTSSEQSWYQRLFATKNLAFGMGALALIFAVGIGFIVIQNLSNSHSSDLAQAPANVNSTVTDSASNSEIAKSTNQTPFEEQDANSINEELQNKNDSNSAVDDSEPASEYPSVEAKEQAGERNVTLKDSETKDLDETTSEKSPKDLGRKDTKPVSKNKPSPVADTIAEESDDSKVKVARDKKEKEKLDARSQDSGVAQKPAAPPKPVTTRRGNRARKSATVLKKKVENEDKKLNSVYTENRQIGKKIFNRRMGVWYDSNYKGQKTTNVKRNTSQYRKLDSGLRSIGNKLKGTVVVVWKSKAYKIQ